jgi:hypothetical protein
MPEQLTASHVECAVMNGRVMATWAVHLAAEQALALVAVGVNEQGEYVVVCPPFELADPATIAAAMRQAADGLERGEGRVVRG